jgi:hypothetical protein
MRTVRHPIVSVAVFQNEEILFCIVAESVSTSCDQNLLLVKSDTYIVPKARVEAHSNGMAIDLLAATRRKRFSENIASRHFFHETCLKSVAETLKVN